MRSSRSRCVRLLVQHLGREAVALQRQPERLHVVPIGRRQVLRPPGHAQRLVLRSPEAVQEQEPNALRSRLHEEAVDLLTLLGHEVQLADERHPYGHRDRRCEIREDQPIVGPGHAGVQVPTDGLQITDEEVAAPGQLVESWRGGIGLDGDVDAALAQRIGGRQEGVHLERRLAAGEGHAAVLAEKRPSLFHLGEQVRKSDLLTDQFEGRVAPSLDAGVVHAACAGVAVEEAIPDGAVRAALGREGALPRVEQHLGHGRDALRVAAPVAAQVAALEVVDEAPARTVEAIAPAAGEDPHRACVASRATGRATPRAALSARYVSVNRAKYPSIPGTSRGRTVTWSSSGAAISTPIDRAPRIAAPRADASVATETSNGTPMTVASSWFQYGYRTLPPTSRKLSTPTVPSVSRPSRTLHATPRRAACTRSRRP